MKMKQLKDIHRKKTFTTSFFCLLAAVLLLSVAGSAYGGHPGEKLGEGHYIGDGHDHGPATTFTTLNDEGVKLLRSKDYNGAAEKFEQALAIDPDNGIVLGMLGKTQVKLEEYEKAVANLTKSLELTENDMINRLTHKSLARAYIGLEKHEEARKEIEAYKEMCIAQDKLTPKTEQIIKELYDSLK
jgi:tetratricopeptide (TPR) repeat protein